MGYIEHRIKEKLEENESKEKETVNHPEHYNKGGIECIEGIQSAMSEESYKGFLKGNVMKYLWRYESKEKPLEDLKKAKWYLEKLIELLEK